MYITIYHKFIILFAWVVLILVLLLSPMPIGPAQGGLTFQDKIVHAFLFGIFAFLVFHLINHEDEGLILNPHKSLKSKLFNTKKRSVFKKLLKENAYFFSFFLSVIFSLFFEYAQVYIPGRTSSDYDFLAGVIGILLVLLLVYGDSAKKS